MINLDKQYHCFKCEKVLTGKCAALKGEGKLTMCLPCLYEHAIIAHTGITYYSPNGKYPGWTHHWREVDGELYWTYPRTMMEMSKYCDANGRPVDKVRYCSDCHKDCGLGQNDLILFYCGGYSIKPDGLLMMQCDSCFTKEVGMWGSNCASTFDGGTVNRATPTVRIYSSPEVIKYDDCLWD